MLQEQFLQLWQQDPESAAYNTPWGICLQGILEIEALQAAVRLLAERHLVRSCVQIDTCSDCTVYSHVVSMSPFQLLLICQ